MSSDNARARAELLVSDCGYRPKDHPGLIDGIVSLMTPPKGCVRDGYGVDRKVLGTLPVTADGCVLGHLSRASNELYGIVQCGPMKGSVVPAHVSIFPLDDGSFSPHEVYSTRQAATSAQAEGGQG